MRYTTTLKIAVVLAAALALAPATEAKTGKAADQAERAAQLILAPEPTEAQLKEGLLLVLDAIAEVAPEAKAPAGFTAKIAEARRRMNEVSLVDGKAVTLLHECYGEVHGGAPFRMPETVRTPKDASNLVGGWLGSVRGLLKQEKPDEALRRMLESVLAVTTPVEAGM